MKLTLARAAILAVVAALGMAPQLKAVPVLDPSSSAYVGLVYAGLPADAADVSTYINKLITVPTGTTVDDTGVGGTGQVYTRSTNTFGSLPSAVVTGNALYTGGSLPSTIDVTGWTYITLKYDGPNYGTLVFDVSGLSGTYSIPQTDPTSGKYGLSTVILFNPGRTVPDSGTTVSLLGLGFIVLAVVRRKVFHA